MFCDTNTQEWVQDSSCKKACLYSCPLWQQLEPLGAVCTCLYACLAEVGACCGHCLPCVLRKVSLSLSPSLSHWSGTQRSGLPLSPAGPPICAGITGTITPTWLFTCGFWGPNMSCACTGITFTTEPASQTPSFRAQGHTGMETDQTILHREWLVCVCAWDSVLVTDTKGV